MNQVLGLYNYWVVIFLMMTGFYVVIARSNLIQKMIGLNIFQISVFLLYITMGNVTGGTAPILQEANHHAEQAEHSSEQSAQTTTDGVVDPSLEDNSHTEHAKATAGDESEKVLYTHPLPSVLMLTAIVVGIATTSLGLALIVRINDAYGSIEEDEILEMDRLAT